MNCASVSKHHVQYQDHKSAALINIDIHITLNWSHNAKLQINVTTCNSHVSWSVLHLPQNILCSPSLFDLSNSYDGSQFVKEVTADYVVWEFNGRIDYGYNSTAAEVNTHLARMHHDTIVLCIPYSWYTTSDASWQWAQSEPNIFLSVCVQVGCVSEPQIWSVLLQNGTHPAQAWTPEVTHRLTSVFMSAYTVTSSLWEFLLHCVLVCCDTCGAFAFSISGSLPILIL